MKKNAAIGLLLVLVIALAYLWLKERNEYRAYRQLDAMTDAVRSQKLTSEQARAIFHALEAE